MLRKKKPADTKDAIAARDRMITRTALEEYVTFLRSPKRVFGINLLAGVARGVGAVLGATIVVTMLLLLLAQLAQLPGVGSYFRWTSEQIKGTVNQATEQVDRATD